VFEDVFLVWVLLEKRMARLETTDAYSILEDYFNHLNFSLWDAERNFYYFKKSNLLLFLFILISTVTLLWFFMKASTSYHYLLMCFFFLFFIPSFFIGFLFFDQVPFLFLFTFRRVLNYFTQDSNLIFHQNQELSNLMKIFWTFKLIQYLKQFFMKVMNLYADYLDGVRKFLSLKYFIIKISFFLLN
jgi:hypothetical protein